MKRLHRLILLSLLLLSPHAAADYPLEIIELQSRTLDEVLPLVQPFAGPDGTVTGMGGKLVVRAAPARLAEIRRILAELDQPPRQLRITVGKADDVARGSRGYNASADIRVGDNGQISINSPGRPVEDSRASLTLRDRETTTTRNSRQFVTAMEGQPAWIDRGVRVPYQSAQGYYGDGRPVYRTTTEFVDVTQGFYVVPRVHGETVTLDILQQDNRPASHPGGHASAKRGIIDTQRIGSSVQGRLGDWIELGGGQTSQSSQQSGIGRSLGSQQSELQGISVKVECLNCPR